MICQRVSVPMSIKVLSYDKISLVFVVFLQFFTFWKFYTLPYPSNHKINTPSKHIIKERDIITPSHTDVIRVR